MRRLARRLMGAFTPRDGFPPRPVLAALLLALAPFAAAGPPPDSERPVDQPLFRRLTSDERVILCGATTVVAGDGGPLSPLAFLRAGQELDVWSFRDPAVVRAIPKDYLVRIEDGKMLTDDPASLEQDAYFLMLTEANRTSVEAFDQAAKENAAVGYAQLYQEPAAHHGQVVHFEGRLKRVRRWDQAPPNAAVGGVRNVYEAWLVLPNNHPVWIIFTELPPGLEVKDEMDVPAGFSGYFFKKVSYTPKKPLNQSAEAKDKPLFAPLVIGRSPTLLAAAPADEAGPPPAPEAAPDWMRPVMTAALAVVGGVGVLLFVMGYLLRRNDAKVRARVNAVRYGELVLPPPPAAPPVAVPVAPPAPAPDRGRDGPAGPPPPGPG